MAITLTSVSPAVLDANGGTRLDIAGDFADHLGELFKVELIPVGGGTPLRALTGRPGRPDEVYALNATRMVCFSPQATGGVSYDLVVTSLVDGAITDTLAAAITVLPKQYNTAVFSYRKVLPLTYITGPRNFVELERVP